MDEQMQLAYLLHQLYNNPQLQTALQNQSTVSQVNSFAPAHYSTVHLETDWHSKMENCYDGGGGRSPLHDVDGNVQSQSTRRIDEDE